MLILGREKNSAKQGALQECRPTWIILHCEKSTVDIPYKETVVPSENTLSSQDKLNKQESQIQYPVITNTISNCDKCNLLFSQIPYPVKTNTITSQQKYNIMLRQIPNPVKINTILIFFLTRTFRYKASIFGFWFWQTTCGKNT